MVGLAVHEERLTLAKVNTRVHLVDKGRTRRETSDLLPPRHEQVVEGRLLDLVPRTLEQLKIPRLVRMTSRGDHVGVTAHKCLDVLDVARLVVGLPRRRLDGNDCTEGDEAEDNGDERAGRCPSRAARGTFRRQIRGDDARAVIHKP